MAQSKLNDFAGKFGKGGPPGLTTGIKVLAALGATAYGISQSLYTGDDFYLLIHFTLILLLGEGWGMCKLPFYPIASATIFKSFITFLYFLQMRVCKGRAVLKYSLISVYF